MIGGNELSCSGRSAVGGTAASCKRPALYEIAPDPLKAARTSSQPLHSCGVHLGRLIRYMTVPGRTVVVTRLMKGE